MNSIFYLITGIIFLVNISIAFMPYWTRKTESFGVSIPETMYDRPDFKVMRKKYASRLTIINIILFLSLIVASFRFQENMLMILFTVFIFVYLLLTFLLYVPFHNKMKNIKQRENWNEGLKQTIIIDPKFRDEKITYSNLWFIIPAIITFFTFIYTWIVYSSIPAQVPTHISFTGEVTYREKSFGTVYMLPFTQLFMFILFLFINYVIKFSKQQIGAANPKVSRQQNIVFRRRWSLYLIITATLFSILFLYIQISMIYPSFMHYQEIVLFVFIGFVMLGTIILMVTTGQGGSRVKIAEEENQSQIERDDDRHWKLGQFYFNKNDPSIFVEKRFGIGWTNNWAHPISWISIIVILGLAIGIPLFINTL